MVAGAAVVGAAPVVFGSESTAAGKKEVLADKQSASLKNRIHQSVCQWCYHGIHDEAFYDGLSAIGIRAVDLVPADKFPVLKKHGLVCSMTSGVPGGIGNGLNKRGNHDQIVKFFEETAPRVADAGFRNIICFSGNRKGITDEEGLENCAAGLGRIAKICEKYNVTAVMELLNSKVDHRGYMCDRTAWGVALCKKVGSDNVKLLYDIYHMQIMEGDVIRTIKGDKRKHIEAAAPYIGHYHTGGVPGRHEIDDSQELFYPAIMQAILDTGYQGWVGQEFLPHRKGIGKMESLRRCVQICDI
jgi:hydroxypyruvate isomerase